MIPRQVSASPLQTTTDSLKVPTDPLFGSQWHLLNFGQNIAGLPQDPNAYRNDIGVVPVWQDYTGKGVVVGVIDDGVQAAHPDLAPNLLADKFYDVDADVAGNPNGSHGTAAMGLILEAQNGLGGVGVAYGSKGIGYKQNEQGEEGFDETVRRMIADGVDVSSNSWGLVGGSESPFTFAKDQPAVEAALRELAESGRDGLGIVTLFAAGNERADKTSTLFDPFTNSPYAITVAAATADGTVASYSSHGPNVLVAAPGSGSGVETANGINSMVTTDLLGTDGYNTAPDGDYTDAYGTGFNGTSAATPVAAGVVALMLEANPHLGYRNVQEILAYSAATPETVATWKTNGATDWNGGGHLFNDDLGFGLIDAHAAVRLAESWGFGRGTLGEAAVATAGFTDEDGIEVKAGDTATVSATFVQPLRVQHVTVSLSMKLENDTPLEDVTVTLIGPDGQVVTPLFDPAAYNTDLPLPDVLTYDFDSVQNWGERADAGEWTLAISNGNAGADLNLTASISVIGDLDIAGKRLVYTDDYAWLGRRDGARQVIDSDPDNPDALNAAAVTWDTYVDLEGGVASIAGVATRIADGATFSLINLGDGDDVVNGDEHDNFVVAGRGDDIMYGGGGNDVLFGGDDDDRLSGDDGNDEIFGDRGDDLLLGQGDDDFLDGGDGQDVVNGGDGKDNVFGSLGDDIVLGADGNDFIGTGSGNDFGSGGFGNDEVHGEEGDDLLFGDDGNDGVYGEAGNDIVHGGTGNDFMTGDAGNDALFGEGGDDQLYGGADADGLSGGAGDDQLTGGDGNDLLFGNAGNDILIGGAGADVFAIGTGDGIDAILDFSAEDVIAFKNTEIESFGDFQSLSTQLGADVIIAYSDSDSLVLQNTQLSTLSAANFTFA
ncbi:S8 family serine peptidase [Methylobacterium tarhaniae]|uniref:S8 family serine peptidase n=1 Tax=Methylobacterium tarhaniae TaxID=1187852 RepID=UPI003D05AA3B